MKSVTYKVSLKGLGTPAGSIPASILRKVVDAICEGSERSLRLAIEGESVKVGRVPEWLQKSTDFLFTKIQRGSTVLVLEAPMLGEVAPDHIRQQDLWYTVPEPDDTALSILTRSIADIKKEKLESERYDPGVLESLLDLSDLVQEGVTIALASERPAEKFSLNKQSFEKITRLKAETPPPQAVVLTGFLNMMKYSQRQFELTSEQGQVFRGKIDESSVSVEQLRELWGKRVTVRGILHFMASKKPRLLEAQVILPRAEGDEAFSTISLPLTTAKIMEPLKREYVSEGLMNELWGKWPGDESLDELLHALHDESES
jgi:hypothetical protein